MTTTNKLAGLLSLNKVFFNYTIAHRRISKKSGALKCQVDEGGLRSCLLQCSLDGRGKVEIIYAQDDKLSTFLLGYRNIPP